MATKQQFLDRYRQELSERYDWTKQAPGKLDRFMHSVASTLSGSVATWTHEGEAVTAAWRAIGGKGKPSLKTLRALTTEEDAEHA